MPAETLHSTSDTQEQTSSEVMFHLAPADPDKPFRRVAGITAGAEVWQDGYVSPDTDLEAFPVTLPDALSEKVLAFAQRHVGPEAPDKETRYFCHTFAAAVGHTAMESAAPEPVGANYGGQAQAGNIFVDGTKIAPDQLGIGEHGVIGDIDENKPAMHDGVEHSMVGIGDGKAIQIDGPGLGPNSGHLYIGRPEDYIDWLKNKNQQGGRPATQLGLYANREPVTVPSEPQPGRLRQISATLRSKFRRQKNTAAAPEPPEPIDPGNPWA